MALAGYWQSTHGSTQRVATTVIADCLAPHASIGFDEQAAVPHLLLSAAIACTTNLT